MEATTPDFPVFEVILIVSAKQGISCSTLLMTGMEASRKQWTPEAEGGWKSVRKMLLCAPWAGSQASCCVHRLLVGDLAVYKERPPRPHCLDSSPSTFLPLGESEPRSPLWEQKDKAGSVLAQVLWGADGIAVSTQIGSHSPPSLHPQGEHVPPALLAAGENVFHVFMQ